MINLSGERMNIQPLPLFKNKLLSILFLITFSLLIAFTIFSAYLWIQNNNFQRQLIQLTNQDSNNLQADIKFKPSRENNECNQNHITPPSSAIRIIRPEKGWDISIKNENNTIFYVETNLELALLCIHQIYSVVQNNSLISAHLHPDIHKTSFIDKSASPPQLIIYDLYRDEIEHQIPIDNALEYQTAYARQYSIDNSRNDIILVWPITFIGGAEDEESAKWMAEEVRKDTSNNEVNVTIARTDGKFIKIKRNTFPPLSDIGRLDAYMDKIILYKEPVYDAQLTRLLKLKEVDLSKTELFLPNTQ